MKTLSPNRKVSSKSWMNTIYTVLKSCTTLHKLNYQTPSFVVMWSQQSSLHHLHLHCDSQHLSTKHITSHHCFTYHITPLLHVHISPLFDTADHTTASHTTCYDHLLVRAIILFVAVHAIFILSYLSVDSVGIVHCTVIGRLCLLFITFVVDNRSIMSVCELSIIWLRSVEVDCPLSRICSYGPFMET